jgi:hypothetical protein
LLLEFSQPRIDRAVSWFRLSVTLERGISNYLYQELVY